jgi:hypothetical protein
MSHRWSRRSFFSLTSGLSALSVGAFTARVLGQEAPPYAISSADAFPQLDPTLAKEAVGVSHVNLTRLREIVEKQPAYARAAMDWGYGDWETCIDAASHVGNRPIAEFLLANGARPTIFTAAMMGQLDVVKAFIAARPGVERQHGPHGITLMAHAKAGGPESAAVVQYLAGLGTADLPTPTRPLDSADRDALAGKYAYGPGARDYFTVGIRQERVELDRPGGPGKHTIMHTGGLEFFPVGVPSTKVSFLRDNGRITQMTLVDPNITVIAKRV